MKLGGLVGYLFPRQVTISHRERLYSGLAGVLAILLTTWLSRQYIGAAVFPFMLASMGASTVLLLGAPHSPLSQPWSFVGGHLVSGAIGISCAQTIPDLYLSAGLAVGLSIAAMYYLRCLHPPGGATALLAVVGDQRIHALGYHLLVMPLLINVLILLAMALLVNRLVPGRRYPISLSLPAEPNRATHRSASTKRAFDHADLLAALHEMNAYIDVTAEDLEQIYSLATLHSHRRRLSDIRLADIMTRQVVAMSPEADLEDLWQTLHKHRIRGVPVVGQDNTVIGVATIVDFMKLFNWRMCVGVMQRLKMLVSRSPKPRVRQIMTRPAITAPATMPMIDAFLIFAEQGINHLPVVDADQRLLGIVTRLDLLSALYGDLTELARN